MIVPTLPLMSLSCEMCENEIKRRKGLYSNVDIPSNPYVVNFGT